MRNRALDDGARGVLCAHFGVGKWVKTLVSLGF